MAAGISSDIDRKKIPPLHAPEFVVRRSHKAEGS